MQAIIGTGATLRLSVAAAPHTKQSIQVDGVRMWAGGRTLANVDSAVT